MWTGPLKNILWLEVLSVPRRADNATNRHNSLRTVQKQCFFRNAVAPPPRAGGEEENFVFLLILCCVPPLASAGVGFFKIVCSVTKYNF